MTSRACANAPYQVQSFALKGRFAERRSINDLKIKVENQLVPLTSEAKESSAGCKTWAGCRSKFGTISVAPCPVGTFRGISDRPRRPCARTGRGLQQLLGTAMVQAAEYARTKRSACGDRRYHHDPDPGYLNQRKPMNAIGLNVKTI